MMKSERVIKMCAVSVFLIVFLFTSSIAHAQVLCNENEQKIGLVSENGGRYMKAPSLVLRSDLWTKCPEAAATLPAK